MEMIDVDGLRIGYERAGDGQPVVFLHGYAGDGLATWRRQLEGLADEFTVIAWDAPGTGRSSDPPEGFGMDGYADCLAGFVAALNLQRPHVAGLSFGGALALELFHRHHDVPETMVLASAYAGWAGSLPPDVTAQRLEQALVLADLSPDDFVDALLGTMFPTGLPRSRSTSLARVCGHSIQSASGPWPERPLRICATCWCTSTSRRC